MKNNGNTILLAAGLIASICSGEQDFVDARKESLSPRVKTLGYDWTYNVVDNKCDTYCVATRAAFDVGVDYSAPIYSHEQYYIGR